MNQTEIENLEKTIGQLEGLHTEIGALARKSPNDALNKFKLGFVNTVLARANEVLGEAYQPFLDFSQFDGDDVPSNSDVTLILAQYLEEMERKRADNIKMAGGRWVYADQQEIKTSAPKKIIGRR